MNKIDELLIYCPRWDSIEQKTSENNLIRPVETLFLCRSEQVAEQLRLANFQNIFMMDMELSEKLQLDQLERHIIASQSIYIVDLLNWLDFSQPYHIKDENKYIETYFYLFKKLTKIDNRLAYCFIYSPHEELSGLVEGLTLSLKKEIASFEAFSLQTNSLKELDFYDLFETYEREKNTFLHKEKDNIQKCILRPLQDIHTIALRKTLLPSRNYVITGNGKIAKLLSNYLTKTYDSKIIILGRRELTPLDSQELKSAGVNSYIKVDLGNLAELKGAWSYLQREYGSINGIFHLAGCLDDKLFSNKDFNSFLNVLYPKVLCTQNLDAVSAEAPLDFFACFSSLTGFVGNIGQSDYAAANAFLRHWSQKRNVQVSENKRQGKTICIDWGLWKAGGMKIPFEQNDVLPMSADEAFFAMEKVLDANESHALIFKGNSSIVLPFTVIETVKPISSSTTLTVDQPQIMDQVGSWVKEAVVKFTKLTNLDINDSILSQGVDSVATINIITDIERDLRKIKDDIRIPKTIIFDHPTIKKLATYLYEKFEPLLQKLFIGENIIVETESTFFSSAPVLTNSINKETISGQKNSDIAIVGLSCQFPQSENFDEFWSNIASGKNCIEVIPSHRWDWKKDYDPDSKAKGKTYSRHGGFLKSIKNFDPLFFNISPSDAERIDPQERLALQNVLHAFEDACIVPSKFENTGVFASVMFGHYSLLNNLDQIIDASYASIANRVSYYFDFKGPSIALDSMCSGSLTAIHMACNSINNDECENAVVIGVNLMPHPAKYRLLSQGRFLSQTGKCHSFGVDADGYVPGEGVGVLILRKASSAAKENDQPYGIIKGTALNSGGRGGGYTVPTAQAQKKVIQMALKSANITPDTISYIETHGTGTSLGDPIEIEGLSEALQGNKNCYIGSVKSNIGHLESAAGMAGVIKVLAQLQHRQLTPTLNCDEENALLNLSALPFSLVKDLRSWDSPGNIPRRAGVSSFGAGGSNAHIIIEENPESINPQIPILFGYILPLSAKSSNALKKQVEKLAEWLSRNPSLDVYSLAYGYACGREHYRHRLTFTFSNLSELMQKLMSALKEDHWNAQKSKNKNQVLNIEEFSFLSNNNDLFQALEQISQAYIEGYDIPWEKIYTQRAVTHNLPTYCFDEIECWSKEFEASVQGSVVPAQHIFKESKEIDSANNINYLAFEWKEDILNIASLHNNSKYINKLLIGKISEDINNYTTYKWGEALSIKLSEMRKASDQPLPIVLELDSAKDLEEKHVVEIVFNLAKQIAEQRLKCNFICLKRQEHSLGDAQLLALSGFFKALTLELPQIKVKFISYSQEQTITNKEIDNEFFSISNQFEEICYQNNSRFLRKLISTDPLKESSECLLRQNSLYVISGGMGKIGQVIAKKLLSQYQARVCLLGSSPLDAVKEKRLQALSEGGGQVFYYQCDITNFSEVKSVIKNITEEKGNINGIIHVAGRLNDKLFLSKEFEDFWEVARIKMEGVINLDKATSALPVDFFAIFSSIASVYGNVGQTDYCYANSFLDEFANARQKLVLLGQRQGRTLSINWPLWTEGGMQISVEKIKYMLEQQGMEPLSNNEGYDIFYHALSSSGKTEKTQIIPIKGDLQKILKFSNDNFRSIQKPSQQQEPSTSFLQKEIVNSLITFVSKISHIDPNQIDMDTSFGEYGFDSVSLQTLADKINERFHFAIPPSAFFTFNTLEKLAQHLGDNIPQNLSIRAPQEEVTQTKIITSKDIIHSTPDFKVSNLLLTPNENSSQQYAIVGAAGYMPGALTLDLFYQNMIQGYNPIVPITRWKNRDYLGALVPQMDFFDPGFFGLSAREAMLMDPQHRLFLQTAFNTMLDAGYDPKSVKNVGVFAGVQFNDYQILLQQWKQSRHPYAATGNAHAMLANRVSYLLDFNGPSQTIDTACSSAIVALKRGIMALNNYECDFALVGAASLLIDHEVTDAAKSMGVLSPNYRCATFDESADGYVRGEGVGCVLLRRYEDAVRDGDLCYGLVVSCAENHGGRSHSLTAPNPEAQKALLLQAYKDKDLASRISYIEAHGTGTKLGDPIEVDSLKAAWKELGVWNEYQQIGLGSVKTHVGHLEPAAGIASLLKVLLSLKYKKLPGNLHFNKLNPYITLEKTPFHIIAENEPWESQELRVAGISSFGFGGSNAHVVIQEAPQRALKPSAEKPAYLVSLSAKTKWSFEQQWKNLQTYLKELDKNDRELTLANISYTLNQGRSHFEYRWAWVVSTLEELITQLDKPLPIDQLSEVTSKAQINESLAPWTDAKPYQEQLNKWTDLYIQGHTLNWEALHQQESKLRLRLPTYPFHTKPFWFEGAADSDLIKEVVNG